MACGVDRSVHADHRCKAGGFQIERKFTVLLFDGTAVLFVLYWSDKPVVWLAHGSQSLNREAMKTYIPDATFSGTARVSQRSRYERLTRFTLPAVSLRVGAKCSFDDVVYMYNDTQPCKLGVVGTI
jgi:hypothetical protein